MEKRNKIPVLDQSSDNVTLYDSPKLQVLSPSDIDDLVGIVEEARRYNKSIYPISTGYNWGLGSKLPVKSESLVVSLREFNKIHEYDAKNGIVVIEPGVTQEQLSTFLKEKKSKFHLDVTGSSMETSILGNALERGITYNSLRVENVLGLEVLTGEGKIIRTGSWRFENSKTKYTYKYGVGADLTGLFFQSNFGIVTKIAYQLRRRQKETYSVQLKYNSVADVSASLDNFSELFKNGVINSIFHIANSERAKNILLPYFKKLMYEQGVDNSQNLDKYLGRVLNCEWFSTGVITAQNKAELKVKAKLIKEKISPFAKVEIINVRWIELASKLVSYFKKSSLFYLLHGLKPFRFLYFGEATNASLGSLVELDRFIKNSHSARFVDYSDNGFMYCLPITELTKDGCDEMVSIIKSTSSKFGFDPSITLNPILPSILEAVVSIDFDKKRSKEAHNCIREMQKNLIAKGHVPYRTNIRDIDLFFSKDTYSHYLKKIKNIFDPDNIIAPGRYLPETLDRDTTCKKLISLKNIL